MIYSILTTVIGLNSFSITIETESLSVKCGKAMAAEGMSKFTMELVVW